MAKITYPNKSTGDQFKATEANEIKASVNSLYDFNENLSAPISDTLSLNNGENTIGQLLFNTEDNKLYSWNGAYWGHADNNNSTGFNFSTKDLICWGDSLTESPGGTVIPYPSQLALISGFNVINKGIAGETSTQIKNRLIADTSNYDKSVIIWAGRNNLSSPETIKADIATMVATLNHNRYLILSIPNGDYEPQDWEASGTPTYNTITQLNLDLATLYGDKYIDIRKILVNSYNPDLPEDVIDFNKDVPPGSLRIDELHFNTSGCSVIANTIYQRLAYLFDSESKDDVIINQSTAIQSASFKISGTGNFVGGAESLKIGTNSIGADNAYIGFYARSSNPSNQSGYIGYNGIGSSSFEIRNNISNGEIVIRSLGRINIINSISASSGIARGSYFTNSLTATANNNDLVALDIEPSFTVGAFTGVRRLGIRSYSGVDILGQTNGTSSILNVRSPEVYNTDTIRPLVFLGSSVTNKDLGKVSSYSVRHKTGLANQDNSILLIASNKWNGSYPANNFDTNPTTSTDIIGITPSALIIQNGGSFVDDGVNRLQVSGSIKSDQYRISALNTAPATSTSTGTTGEIRWTSTHIYLCTATNTWVRAALATF